MERTDRIKLHLESELATDQGLPGAFHDNIANGRVVVDEADAAQLLGTFSTDDSAIVAAIREATRLPLEQAGITEVDGVGGAANLKRMKEQQGVFPISETAPHGKKAKLDVGKPKANRSPSSVPPPSLGRPKVGRYEVIYPMAAGGMASVHLGRLSGLAGFERLVAIKVIHPHLSNRKLFVDMFLDEARLAAQLHHPNIGEIIEVGEDDGVLYMVGELILGCNLHKLFRRARKKGVIISQPLIAYVMSRVCRALHAAHELVSSEGDPLRLVHRDVSPHNIMISYAGDVKLIDFGIVHAEGRLSHTEVGLFKGKSGFVSPEQGRGETLDRRSDIFSVGVTLYLLVTGSLPFETTNEHQRIIQLQKGEFPEPSRLNPKIDPDLERIILKSMQVKPDNRYQTASELAYDLEGFISREEHGDFVQELSGLTRKFFVKERQAHKLLLRRHRHAMGEVSSRIELSEDYSSHLARYEDSGELLEGSGVFMSADAITSVERRTDNTPRAVHSSIRFETVEADGALGTKSSLFGNKIQMLKRMRYMIIALTGLGLLAITIGTIVALRKIDIRKQEISESSQSNGMTALAAPTAPAMAQGEELSNSASKMTVTLETAQTDYAVLVDGVLIGQDLTSLQLVPDGKQHRITVRKTGARDFEALFIAHGDTQIQVSLPPLASKKTSVEKNLKNRGHKSKKHTRREPGLMDTPYK
ncbi:MAG: serine/threonine protein kinase [Deltaproteobacteria bacterium]|nr:serine/threonine protein kinase [Deltaproteobacteria bacterium]